MVPKIIKQKKAVKKAKPVKSGTLEQYKRAIGMFLNFLDDSSESEDIEKTEAFNKLCDYLRENSINSDEIDALVLSVAAEEEKAQDAAMSKLIRAVKSLSDKEHNALFKMKDSDIGDELRSA